MIKYIFPIDGKETLTVLERRLANLTEAYSFLIINTKKCLMHDFSSIAKAKRNLVNLPKLNK